MPFVCYEFKQQHSFSMCIHLFNVVPFVQNSLCYRLCLFDMMELLLVAFGIALHTVPTQAYTYHKCTRVHHSLARAFLCLLTSPAVWVARQ